MKHSFLKVLAGVCFLSMFAWAVAQTPGPSPQVGIQAPPVTLEMIVTDKSDHFIDDVDRSELQVFEDGKLQELSSLASEKKPVKYAIVIDSSLSFKNLLVPSLAACKLLIDDNGTDDETALIRFVSSDKIYRVQDFTSDKTRLVNGLKEVYLDKGQSAVIDAVYMAVQSTASYKAPDFSGRRAVVLISDGEDRHSYYTIDALVKLLRESNVQVFVIGIVTELEKESGFIKLSPQEKAKELLARLARETGGRIFLARDASGLRTAAQEVAHDLRTQFTISYRPSAILKKGSHKIEVKTLGPRKLKAITRARYLAH